MFQMMRRISLVLVCVLLFSVSSRAAQLRKNDRDGIASYVASVAKTVYSFAWPTATYRTWEVDGIHPTDHGFEVVVKLTGTSAFGGGDLWLRLALVFSNGQFERFRMIDNNAVLMQPFATSTIVGSTAVYLADQYAAKTGTPAADSSAQPPAPVPAISNARADAAAQAPLPQEGICLTNTTGRTLAYEYLAGSDWKPITLSTGNATVMWRSRKEHLVNGVPQYYVRYLDGAGTEAPLRTYKLPTGIVPTSPDCKDAPNYHFEFSGQQLQIFTGAPSD